MGARVSDERRSQETVRVGGEGPPSQDTPPTGYTIPPQAGYIPPPPYPAQPPVEGRGPRFEHTRRHSVPIVGPVLLIGAGALFLLNNLDILPWSVWGALWRLWPLVLIAIGLDMLLGRRNQLLSGLLVLGVLGAGVGWLYASGGLEGWGRMTRVPLSVPLNNAESASVSINIGSSELKLGQATTTGLLAEGTLDVPERAAGYQPEVTRQGSRVELQLSQQDGDWSFPFGPSKTKWDVRLAPSVPLNLSVNVGSGNAELDLHTLRVTSLDLDVGSGDMTVTLPASANMTEGRADIGSGDLTLYVPEGVSADIKATTGSGDVHHRDPFRQEGDRYLLGNPGESRNRVTLQIHVGSGDVELRSGLP